MVPLSDYRIRVYLTALPEQEVTTYTITAPDLSTALLLATQEAVTTFGGEAVDYMPQLLEVLHAS